MISGSNEFGEILRWHSIKLAIEDVSGEEPHVHYYYQGKRQRAFFDFTNKCFYIKKTDIGADARASKAALKLMNDNYDFIKQQYETAKQGKPVIRIKLQ